MTSSGSVPSREQLVHALYEAAELEHNLMCTYLYAAFSLRAGVEEGLSPEEATAVAGWRREIVSVAIEEMGHLAAVWNITSALGAVPRFGRGNFPLDPGALPAGVVVKLAPFDEAVLQHFIHLERPADSSEPDGAGFAPEFSFRRAATQPRITPMGMDYDTVGEFYARLSDNLRAFVEHRGEASAFCGDPALQLSPAEAVLPGSKPVICLKTALAAFESIVQQGEGASADASGSHFQRFVAIRTEFATLKARNPSLVPAYRAATNPVQRTPMRPAGRVWIEDEHAARTVDVANAAYGLMLRLISYAYAVPRPSPEKALVVDLSLGLMRAMSVLGEHAARLPAGPSNPGCNAGMSFIALRDAGALPPGVGARRFFVERLEELADAAAAIDGARSSARIARAAAQLAGIVVRARREFAALADSPAVAPTAAAAGRQPASPAPVAPTPVMEGAVEAIRGEALTLLYEGRKCIHARFCVTGAPKVFLANVQGPWIHPDAMEPERLVDIAHACPSGAIGYRRHDGHGDETAPPVNLLAIREAGPYAVRGNLRLDGATIGFRATLCRCGASKNKPFCDGSHHEINFDASGEPGSRNTDMLPVRDGALAVDPEPDGPLRVRGNLEITSGTGRVVSRVTSARLCRCGASQNKPFCDGSHVTIGFRS